MGAADSMETCTYLRRQEYHLSAGVKGCAYGIPGSDPTLRACRTGPLGSPPQNTTHDVDKGMHLNTSEFH